MYKFVVTEKKAGDYCCNVGYKDGDTRMSTCYVESGGGGDEPGMPMCIKKNDNEAVIVI